MGMPGEPLPEEGGGLIVPALETSVAARLIDVVARFTAGQTVTEILDGIFENFRSLLPYDRMEFAAIEEDGHALRTVWVRTTYQQILLRAGFVYRRPTRFPSLEGETPPYIELNPAFIAFTRPPDHPWRLLHAEGLRSGLSCPLSIRGEKVGFLFFCAREADAYRPEHLGLIHQVAGLVAGALYHTRLRGELQHRNRELEDLTRSRAELLAMVSHELRTPLAGAMGLAVTLRDQLGSLESTEVEELVRMVADQCVEASGIVDDLLVVVRSEAGKLVMVDETVDLGAEVDRVAKLLGVALTIHGAVGLARGDSARVRQIVRNLIVNAQRYGGERIEAYLGGEEGQAALAIVDNGHGIPVEARHRMFQPFERAGRVEGSTGLGLWLSRRLAERMGGSLEYERTDDLSRFTLRLAAVAD